MVNAEADGRHNDGTTAFYAKAHQDHTEIRLGRTPGRIRMHALPQAGEVAKPTKPAMQTWARRVPVNWLALRKTKTQSFLQS